MSKLEPFIPVNVRQRLDEVQQNLGHSREDHVALYVITDVLTQCMTKDRLFRISPTTGALSGSYYNQYSAIKLFNDLFRMMLTVDQEVIVLNVL